MSNKTKQDMIYFINNNTATFLLDNHTNVLELVQRLGLNCKLHIPRYADQYRGANEGTIKFANEVSEFEKTFLSK